MVKDLLDAPPVKMFSMAAFFFALACPTMLAIALYKPEFFERTDFAKLLMISVAISVPFVVDAFVRYEPLVRERASLAQMLKEQPNLPPDALKLVLSAGVGTLAIYFVCILKAVWPELSVRAAAFIMIGAHVAALNVVHLAMHLWVRAGRARLASMATPQLSTCEAERPVTAATDVAVDG